jgi:predicted aldo/keto reductase-like oxidoreductase
MKIPDHACSMSRRGFIKLGIAGAAASLGIGGASDSVSAEAPSELQYRTLGRTGLKVTAVGFGAMLTPESEVIRAGLDRGINYLDTARVYLNGRSEEIVSRAVRGIREKLYVATKTRRSSNTKEEIVKDVERSLSNLQTDHIDVIQLHSLDSPERAFISEVREAYLKLRDEGKVRFFGVTTHTNQAAVINAIVDDPAKFFDTVLVQYNFKADPSVKQAIARAAKAGIGVIAMKTQAGGYKTQELGQISPHQAALKWVLQDANVATAIPGMKTLGHIEELMPVMGMKLARSDKMVLERYARGIERYYCTLCGQCESACPNGVEISVVNRALMYAQGYREYELARRTYKEAPHASSCSFCTECVARCINGLDIARKMGEARRIFA